MRDFLELACRSLLCLRNMLLLTYKQAYTSELVSVNCYELTAISFATIEQCTTSKLKLYPLPLLLSLDGESKKSKYLRSQRQPNVSAVKLRAPCISVLQ